MPPDPQTAGFIGLGAMGHHMAQNLFFNSNDRVKMIVFEVDQAAGSRLVAAIREKDPTAVSRVTVAHSPTEVAESAAVTVMALPTSTIVKQVVTELSQSLSPSAIRLIINLSSTNDPEMSQECARLLAGQGSGTAQFIDAATSSGDSVGAAAAAAAGTLTFMVRYPPEESSTPEQERFAQEHLLPILRTMGNTVCRMGDVGSGGAI